MWVWRVKPWLNQYINAIHYEWAWDFWDSYTWWWIYLIFFEFVGGLIIPDNKRKPIAAADFRIGGWAFYILHLVLITTTFAGGFYMRMAVEQAGM